VRVNTHTHTCTHTSQLPPRPTQSLYGHYLLPNGKLAHFAHGDTVRKGHKVRGRLACGIAALG